MPLIRGKYKVTNEVFLLDGSVTQVANAAVGIRSSVDRRDINNDNAAALATGVLTAVALTLEAGDVVTTLTAISGATPAGTPTHWGFALYGPWTSGVAVPLLGNSADQGSAAWAAQTAKSLAIIPAGGSSAAPVTIQQPGVYYFGIWVAATTVPSLPCCVLPVAAVSGPVVTGQAPLALTTGAGLTTAPPSTLPASPTAVANLPYVVVS